VSTLLDLGEDVHSPGPRGTALAVACINGDADAVQLLLQAGASIELETSAKRAWQGNYTPLKYAVRGNHVNLVKLLLAEGADVNGFHNHNITTSLQEACINGDEEMVDLLLSAGARVNDEPGYMGNSLASAIDGGNVSIINKLQNLGGYLDLAQQDYFVSKYLSWTSCVAQERARHVLSMNISQDPQQRAFVQSSLLRVAVRRGYKDLVSMMLRIGTDVNSHNHSGETPLIIAAEFTTSSSLFFIGLLLQHGADVNKVVGDNSSALHTAAVYGNADAVELLLENGADVNCVSGEGSVLNLATEMSNPHWVKSDIDKRARYQAVIDTLLAHGAQDIPPPP